MFYLTIGHKILYYVHNNLFGQPHPKCEYQLVENFRVYLHAKKKTLSIFFSMILKKY